MIDKLKSYSIPILTTALVIPMVAWIGDKTVGIVRASEEVRTLKEAVIAQQQINDKLTESLQNQQRSLALNEQKDDLSIQALREQLELIEKLKRGS